MENKKKLLIGALVLVLVLGGAWLLYSRLGGDSQQLGQESEEQELQLAPDFVVYDAQGNAARLTDYRGKPVVLNFWASWCGPCKMEMPEFQQVYETLGDEIHFLMVNATDGSRETVDTASALIGQEGYTFPVFYDTEMSASTAYGVYSLPTTYFIDAQGYAVAQARGAISAETLQKGIDMIRE